MAIKSEYGTREVEAAKRILIELMQILGEYREQIVLVGGWVPFFLFGSGHVGSMDIDIALNRDSITDDVYRTIRENLEARGYRQGKQPFIFLKDVNIDEGDPITVEIDFLAGEYGGTGKAHRHQKIQDDLLARKTRGCDLALQYNTTIAVEGKMPDGSSNRVEVRMSNLVPFIVMKGMALYDRYEEKDAWDIYFCIKHFSGGVEKLTEQFGPVVTDKIVQEGLAKIRSKFRTLDDMGPSSVVMFEAITDPEEQRRVRRDAYEQVSALLDGLDIQVGGRNLDFDAGLA